MIIVDEKNNLPTLLVSKEKAQKDAEGNLEKLSECTFVLLGAIATLSQVKGTKSDAVEVG
jgi:hypothetical protein